MKIKSKILSSLLWLIGFSCAVSIRAAAPIPLRAGPLTMMFEPDNVFLRYIQLGPYEVLRGIYAPVRDQFWGTVRPVVSDLELDNGGDHFTLKFKVVCRERDIDFHWSGLIKGSSDGEIEFTFDGTALSSFQRNRIGFCVLHAPSAAGWPWIIESVTGEKTKGHFPTYISPHQPAKGIREVTHELTTNLWAHVRMEGDTFEMEDQRNWTDASFKTYCTPLELPYPVLVPKGTKVAQKISIRVEGALPTALKSGTATPERTLLNLTREQTVLPRIGLQVSSQTTALSAREQALLKELNLDHLRVDLALTNEFIPQFRQAKAQAKALGIKLHVGLRLDPKGDDALNLILTEAAGAPVAGWFLIGTNAPLSRHTRDRLKTLRGKAWVGVEHDDVNFTELNRLHPAPDMMEVVAYGVTPQIHAFDNLSMMETLPILVDTVRSARQFIEASPLFITPITLRLQAEAKAPLPGELPSSVDPRQITPFAASWTLGSIKYLAESGVHSLTYYETVGWKGVMESAAGTPLPDKFPSHPGQVFPIYHVLREVGEFAGGSVQRIDSSDNRFVAALALTKGKRLRLLIANLTDRAQLASLRGLGETVEVRSLDFPENPSSSPAPEKVGEGTALEVPLVLPPYGILRIDRPALTRERVGSPKS